MYGLELDAMMDFLLKKNCQISPKTVFQRECLSLKNDNWVHIYARLYEDKQKRKPNTQQKAESDIKIIRHQL